ncbi:MAG: putative NAD-dependent protein deacetylase sir-2, partial [Streblomastix strix]
IIVIGGAGMSISCGMPDFQSLADFFVTLKQEGVEQPNNIFYIEYFKQDPSLFYNHAKRILPSRFIPSISHFFLNALDQSNKILNIFTQNIDDLERRAGVRHVLQCHGTMGLANCMRCKEQIVIEDIEQEINSGQPAYCKKCTQSTHSDDQEQKHTMDESTSIPIYKPSVVFFGEEIPQEFYQIRDSIIDKCDLLVVLGNSLKSKPVSDIILDIDNSIPQILINKEVVGPPNHFDICLIGDCDEICGKIAQQIGMVIPVSEQQRKRASVIATDQLIRERKGIMIKEEDEDVDIEKDNNETLHEQNEMV